jgi:hypothetical protein
MWSRISLRIKITIITAVALSLVTVCITWFSNYNVWRNVITPLENLEVGQTEFDIYFRIYLDEHGEELGEALHAQDGILT